jgi:hypothetical protein
MARAEALLAEPSGVEAQELRARIFQLAEALFQSIGMQLSVDRYRAIGVGRGAMLDTLDLPLNNRVWLAGQFSGIRGLPTEAERLAAIDRIVTWTDPGPGGFYDDLGNATAQPRLHPAPDFGLDPAAFDVPRVNFADEPFVADARGKLASTRRTSWFDHAEALYDAPMRMNYTGLDPAARYRVRVVYAGDNYVRKLRLVANGTTEIHPWIEKPVPFKALEFALPAETTRGGQLSLTWTSEPGLGGNGRACQVSEVWILKEPQ